MRWQFYKSSENAKVEKVQLNAFNCSCDILRLCAVRYGKLFY